MGGIGETSVPAGEPEGPAQPQPGPDDEFDRALRSLTEGTTPSAGVREPSAAERKKAAAQARRKRERARKRYAKLEKQDRKEERKQGKKHARRARAASRGHRSRGRAAVTAVVIVALGGGGWFAGTQLHLASLATGGPNDTQVVTNGAVPALSPVSPAKAAGPPADPFAGTPADNWADGAAGIVIPQASPVGQYSAAQVSYAYQTTKKLLSAAALDKKTLLGGAPTAFTSLLSKPNQTQFISNLDKIGVDKNGVPLSSRGYIISFAPGTTKLIGTVIKVHGTMSAHATTDSNGGPVLEVRVNYLITYPVEPPRAPEDWMRLVAHFTGNVTFGNWSGAATPFEAWWEAGPSVAGARCAMPDGYQHPDFPNGPPDKVQASGPAVDPYSMQQVNTKGCGQTTGT